MASALLSSTTSQSERRTSARIAGPQSAIRQRVLELLQTEIEFIPNSSFRHDHQEHQELVESALSSARVRTPALAELPSHLQRLCEVPLLTQGQEVALFREMNRLKFRANAMRVRLDPDEIDEQTVASIDSMLGKAQVIRDHIISANMRLVMSVVKKFVTPLQSFDELLSEGIVTLMQTVEKFDYDRGFRFSTYAYRSIARNAFRSVSKANKDEARVTRDADEWAFEQEAGTSSSLTDQVWGNVRELTSSLLSQLDRRERFIIRSRYALGAHRRVRTFQFLADKLGVSKERVRQLEQRAVAKLRAMASEYEMDDLFGAAMV